MTDMVVFTSCKV